MKNFIGFIGSIGFIGQGGGKKNPITGIGPTLGPLVDGDALGVAVTWGTYQPAGVTVMRQMRVDGGAWQAYDSGIEVTEGEVWQIREVVSVPGFKSTFTSDYQTVEGYVPAVPVNTIPPEILGTLVDGETTTLTGGTWVPTADEIEREWLADSIVVGTGFSLDLTGREGEVITARTRARVSGGEWSDWEDATGGGVVAAASAPVNTHIPAILGLLEHGSELTFDVGMWTGDVTQFEIEITQVDPTATLLARQVVSGTTTGTLTTTVGGTLTLKVWATGPGGVTSVSSETFGPILPAGDTWVYGFVLNPTPGFNPTPAGSPVTYTHLGPGISGNVYASPPGYGWVGTNVDPGATSTFSENVTRTDPRLKGRWIGNSTPAAVGLRIDLPDGPGTYIIHAGFGSSGGSSTPRLSVRNGSSGAATVLYEINADNAINTGSGENVMDIAGNVTTAADWTAASMFGGEGVEIEVTGSSIWVGRPTSNGATILNCFSILKKA